MISYDDALARIRAHAGASETVQRPLIQATGRVCAAPVYAGLANQPFDNSAMDGYGVRAADLSAAADSSPVTLENAGEIAAGQSADNITLEPGQCCSIMTGAPVPEGCDAVVPVENVEGVHNGVQFFAPIDQGANIRRAGEDIAVGDELISPGTRLHAGHILPLATIGIDTVAVYQPPRVGIISTGAELIDDFSAELEAGQIYNSNAPYLERAVAALGGEPVRLGSVGDDGAAFQACLDSARDQALDVVISSGAVSAGEYDFVPARLRDAGAELAYHKLAIRPGKPNVFAHFNGVDPVVFGLPGNPVSVAAGMRFLVTPYLRKLEGLPDETPIPARITHDFTKRKRDMTFFLKAYSYVDEAGTYQVEILPGQESFKVSPFTQMNCWVFAGEGVEGFSSGEIVATYPVI